MVEKVKMLLLSALKLKPLVDDIAQCARYVTIMCGILNDSMILE